ncbi:CapA family protein [Patescibacteria group bacterium]|nr:CapA family protein [Patescibacteria group bacterium]
MKYLGGTIVLIIIICITWFGYHEYQTTKNHVADLHEQLAQTQHDLKENEALQTNLQTLELKLAQQTDQEKIYTIFAIGDIMLDRGVETKIKNLGQDYSFSFDLIKEDLTTADIVFANLEGSVSDIGVDTGKEYSFRFEPIVVEALSDSGIDVVSLANNHILDWGRDALCDTTKNLDRVGIYYVGAGCNNDQAEAPYIVTLGDTRVAFLAYTEFYIGAHATSDRPGLSEYNMEKISNRIHTLKEQSEVDLVFVSMHWGEEYKNRATLNQVVLGRALVDAGADVVIGHHPHVDQEIERYDNGWIIYSLGNFVFDQSWSEETMQGLLAEIQIQHKHVYDIVPKMVQLNSNYQPYLVQ